jgi:hypothetical protein
LAAVVMADTIDRKQQKQVECTVHPRANVHDLKKVPEALSPSRKSYRAPQAGDNAPVTMLHTMSLVPIDRLKGTLAIGLLPCRQGIQPHSHLGTSSSTVNHTWPHESQPRLRVTRSSSCPLVEVALILSLLHRGHFMGKMGGSHKTNGIR